MLEYRRIDRTNDLGFWVRSPTWQRLFVDCALALTEIRVPLRLLGDGERVKSVTVGTDMKTGLAAWLNESLRLFRDEQFLPTRILVEKFDGLRFEAVLLGDKYNAVKHGRVEAWGEVVPEKTELAEEENPTGFSAKVFCR